MTGHSDFYSRLTFYLAEIEYWKAEALRLRDALETVERGAQQAVLGAPTPPEPPIGTKFSDLDAKTGWVRWDDGWHCALVDCPNCPATWVEAQEFIQYDAVRTLPGVS